MRCFIEHLLSSGVLLICLLISHAAFAQDACKDLNSNEAWNDGMKHLSSQIQNGQYDEARQTSKRLSEICNQSPVLNYMQGKIAEEQGNRQDALLYYQKASEYTYLLAVAPDMAKKIWYARYENENPERTAKSIREKDEKVQMQLDASSDRIQGLEHKLYQVLWTGAGIGIGGLAMLGTGVGLLMYNGNEASKTKKNLTDQGYIIDSYRNDSLYTVSWGLIGAGAALTIAGAIVTGIYGYQYTHLDNSYAFVISPLGTSFNIEF
ncbi:MAG: hypothetical protein J6A01_10180 [Proteobacteria bacterium]|nr:hypothetical protein [Pseudomonadota bacterium]